MSRTNHVGVRVKTMLRPLIGTGGDRVRTNEAVARPEGDS